MYEALLEFENELIVKYIPNKPQDIEVSDKEINEKYLKSFC